MATNLSVGPKEAGTFCRRYSRRWQTENEYKSIKHDFLAKTSSKDYCVRLFYFVFAVLNRSPVSDENVTIFACVLILITRKSRMD